MFHTPAHKQPAFVAIATDDFLKATSIDCSELARLGAEYDAEQDALDALDASRRADIRLGNPNAKHLYQLGVCSAGVVYSDRTRFTIDVDANDRAQATRIAERAGYYVADCNMVG